MARQTCNACPLGETCRGVVRETARNPKLVLYGEAPGETEDETGLPFTGKSGEILGDALRAAGLSRLDVYVGNVVACKPLNGRLPKKPEIAACRQKFLLKDIERFKGVPWVLLGALAIKEIGGATRGVASNRERKWTSPDGLECWGAPHPAAVARGSFRTDQISRVLLRALGRAQAVKLRDPIIPVVSLDTETTGLDAYRKARPFIATTCDGKDAMLFDLTESWDRFKLQQVISNAEVVTMANALFDWTQLEALGFKIDPSKLRDVQWAAAAHDSGNCPYPLERLGNYYFKQGGSHKTNLKDFLKGKKLVEGFKHVPREILNDYAIQDAVLTYALDQHPELVQARNQYASFHAREHKLLPVLKAIEERGILVDIDAVKAATIYLKEEAERLLTFLQTDERVASIVADYNPNSAPQTQLLMEELGFQSPERTKSGNLSYGKTVLKMFGHPITDAVHDVRHFRSLAAGAVKAILNVLDRNGCVHPSYHSLGSETGRFTCTTKKENDNERINLMGIPKIPVVRRGWRARPGFIWMCMDTSQIEMRGIANYSHEQGLIRAYKENPNEDYYSLVGRMVEGKEISKEDRQHYKTVSLAKGYGIGAKKLAKLLVRTIEWVKQFIALYDARMPGVAAFYKEVDEIVRRDGQVMCVDYPSKVEPRAAYQGVNRIVQGSCAVHLKRILIELHDMLKDTDDVHIIHHVHDEVDFEIRPHVLSKWIPEIKRVMESGWGWEVPVIVKCEIGPNWGDLEEVQEKGGILCLP